MSLSPHIYEELDELAAAVEQAPQLHRGAWKTYRTNSQPFDAVCIDYGSGMGDYAVELAKRFPRTLYIGVELELFCIAKSARKAIEAGIENAIFVPANVSLDEMFAPAEVSCIYINHPTPHAHARDAAKRMTHINVLEMYRSLLNEQGSVRLKTDSQPFFDFSLTQFVIAGYEILWQTKDLRAKDSSDPSTVYEDRLVAEGAKIFACEARPSKEQYKLVQTAKLSLFDYLPEDLTGSEYIPTDMRKSVLRDLQAKRKIEENRKQKRVR